MKRTALALAAIFASTAFASAFTLAPQTGPSGIQLVQDKMKKDEKMSKDDKMKKDSMMKKDDKMKKDEMKK